MLVRSLRIWWEYRTLFRNIYPELRARANLHYGNYTKAIYWLCRMMKRSNDVRFSAWKSMDEQQAETRAKIAELLGEYHLKWIIMDERIEIEHNKGGSVCIKPPANFWAELGGSSRDNFLYLDLSSGLEEIGNCALHKIGNLPLAKRAFELRGLNIPDDELLKYAKMCANELKEEEARAACLLVKEITPLAAYQQCFGPNAAIPVSK